MSFGAGLGAGMGAGIGAGIAIGIAAGQETARKKVVQYAELHEITVRDKAGKPIPWDEFLHEATASHSTTSSKGWILALLVGLTVLALGGTLFFWHLVS